MSWTHAGGGKSCGGYIGAQNAVVSKTENQADKEEVTEKQIGASSGLYFSSN